MIDFELLTDMYYAAPELWYALIFLVLVLIVIIISELFKILRLKQKNYFVNRDRERYAETLYASKDGYFAFIHPDDKVNDPRQNIVERCSRRLAVIMNLPNGTRSSFEEILKNFYKDDEKKIRKYVALLQDDGVSFDDEFILKSTGKCLRLCGARISGTDGDVYCDMIWFRDVSFETNKIINLEQEKNEASSKARQLQDLIDNIPFPVWLRDDNLKIIDFNKKFTEFTDTKTSNDDVEINNINGESFAKRLAQVAHLLNKPKKEKVSVIKDGERLVMEAFETPFHAEESLEKIYTVGALVDVSELDDLKRNLRRHQVAQLEILGSLGTAFAVFNQDFKLNFYNKSFCDLWQLDESWLDEHPSYSMFLDATRERRLLPEVPDYVLFKNEEQKQFSQIIEPKNDMLHLPNGKTLRRVRAPYPMGGLIFAYEDISDRLATTSAYNALLSVQEEMLENLFDAVVIFGSNGRLSFYNQAYLKLWNSSKTFLESQPDLDEFLESQKSFFSKDEDWNVLKKEIAGYLLSMTTKTFILGRGINGDVEVSAQNLSDGSMMIVYKKL